MYKSCDIICCHGVVVHHPYSIWYRPTEDILLIKPGTSACSQHSLRHRDSASISISITKMQLYYNHLYDCSINNLLLKGAIIKHDMKYIFFLLHIPVTSLR